MPEIPQEAVQDGGSYYPIPPQGCASSGISVRDKIAERTFVRLLGDAFQAQMGSDVDIPANDFAVQSFAAADAWLKARALV